MLTHDGRYYLYGTRGETAWGPASGFDVYVGDDLETWSEPIECFRNDGAFWATSNYWAPEVYAWQGRFVMFASFKADDVCRCTCSLVADTPTGPFRPLSDGGLTPSSWECLDGTLAVAKDGKPYIVFCHEWVQIVDGTICAAPLSDDLSRTIGEPRVLLRASEGQPWVKQVHHRRTGIDGYVTDGAFTWRLSDGTLLLLWSSFSTGGYTLAMARSDGDVTGLFIHDPIPLFDSDGGHGMVFRTLDGRLMLTLHSPNDHLRERPRFYELREENGRLNRA